MTDQQQIERPKYEYGQRLFAASWESTEERVTCPDCGGGKTIECHLWDGGIHIIDCVGCAAGYEPPRGYLTVHVRRAIARPAEIVSVSQNWDGAGFEYRANTGCGSQYCYQEADLFLTEAEALAAAEQKAAKADQEERDQIARKEKPGRSWAWNIHYHRKCIRDAEKQIAYHTAKLNAGKAKSKAEAAHD